MHLERKIALLMARSGDNQATLAERLRVSPSTVGRWLDGAKPRRTVLTQIASYFDIDANLLEDDTKSIFPDDESDPPEENQGVAIEMFGKRFDSADIGRMNFTRLRNFRRSTASMAELLELSEEAKSGFQEYLMDFYAEFSMMQMQIDRIENLMEELLHRVSCECDEDGDDPPVQSNEE